MVDKPADLCMGERIDGEDWVYMLLVPSTGIQAVYGHNQLGRGSLSSFVLYAAVPGAVRADCVVLPAWNTELPDDREGRRSWRRVRRSEFEALLDMERARLAVGA